MVNFKKLQLELDQINCSPTHVYSLSPFKPKGLLKERIAIIKSIAPCFFKGKRFLDIGCSKGYFSLLASQNFHEIVSIDTNNQSVKFCQKIQPINMRVYKVGFRDFIAEDEFDKIFIGNTLHHVFKEANGWDCIYKLAALSSGEVLIEGSIDVCCQDVKNIIPKKLHQEFTFEKFMKIMEKFFILKKKILKVPYSPNKFLMYFQRKSDLFQKNSISIEEIPKGKLLRDNENSQVNLVKLPQFNKPVVIKILKNIPKYLKMSIAISRFSPVSNDILGSVYKRDKFVGWVEPYTPGGTYNYREKEEFLFIKICEHEIFLSRLGYFDTDCAAINFFRASNKIFDKGAIMPISNISEKVYESFRGRPRGYFFIHLNNSFTKITYEFQEQIYNAIKSRDAKKIENTFLQIKEMLQKMLIFNRPNSFLSSFFYKLSRKLGDVTPVFLTKFKDFCPISENEALISIGNDYSYLTYIRRVKYKLKDNRVKIFFWLGKNIVHGTHLRLGNIFNNKLLYSDEQNIFEQFISKKILLQEKGAQPYKFEGGLLYNHNGSIYLNKQKIICPWSGFGIVNSPFLKNNWVYFGARKGFFPWNWQVWCYNIKTKKKNLVLSNGANPYIYSGKLFYSKWEKGRFNVYYIKEPNL